VEQVQDGPIQLVDPVNGAPRKYYIDQHSVEIAGAVVFDLDAEGRRLRAVRLTEYAGLKVKTLWRDADELKDAWTDLDRRAELLEELEKRGIELADLAKAANQSDAGRSIRFAPQPRLSIADPHSQGSGGSTQRSSRGVPKQVRQRRS
jgi:hypothetical protein